ncbi:MAG: DUF3426 domain-containing protein [Sedimenticola sp.]
MEGSTQAEPQGITSSHQDVADSLNQLLEELESSDFVPHDADVHIPTQETPAPRQETTRLSDYLAELDREADEEPIEEPTAPIPDLLPEASASPEEDDELPESQLSFQILDDDDSGTDEAMELPWATTWDQEMMAELASDEISPSLDRENHSQDLPQDEVGNEADEHDLAHLQPAQPDNEGQPGDLHDEPDNTPATLAPTGTDDTSSYEPPEQPLFIDDTGEMEEDLPTLTGGPDETTEEAVEPLYDEPDTIPTHFALEETEMASSDEPLQDDEPTEAFTIDTADSDTADSTTALVMDEEVQGTPEDSDYEEPDTVPTIFVLEETEMASSEEVEISARPGERDREEQENELPFDLPEGLPDIEPSSIPPVDLDSLDRELATRRNGNAAWSISIVLLIVLALAQLSWFGRDHLDRYPALLNLVTEACVHLDCKLTPDYAPDKYTILNRMMVTHPEQDDALMLLLSFTNQAAHAQPYPLIQLSLYDNNQSLTARRTFTPAEYMNREVPADQLVPPGSIVQVEMPLEDPGSSITGFQFDFL